MHLFFNKVMSYCTTNDRKAKMWKVISKKTNEVFILKISLIEITKDTY